MYKQALKKDVKVTISNQYLAPEMYVFFLAKSIIKNVIYLIIKTRAFKFSSLNF